MDLKITLIDEELSLVTWLAGRIQNDVLEKYGLEIKVTIKDNSNELSEQQNMVSFAKQDSKNLGKIPDVLEPKHIQQFLGMSQRKTYDFLADAPFRVVKVGRIYKISKSSFLKWFHGFDQ